MDQFSVNLSNMSLYDMKAYVRKAQNAVLNFSEMEAKVREATNNEPWGTPTSTMQYIAEGTNNYQQFHEIMPFIYRRFTEKSAAEWRQIYKALQLLDYLVRNGSERVVDYARSHISVIEMLRHFSYVDRHGKDQGASIRKRADELVALLGSTEKLRSERKRARQLNQKTGLAGMKGGFGGSGRKYGGLSSDSYREMKFGGSAGQQVFGDGGGFDGSNHIVAGAARDNDFEEYDAGDAADPTVTATRTESGGGTDAGNDDDDDFAEFQTAPTVDNSAHSSDKPLTSSNILDLFDTPAVPASSQPSGAGLASFSQPPSSSSQPGFSQPSTSSSASLFTSSGSSPATGASKKAPVDDIFGSLWESSKSGQTKPANGASNASTSKSTPSASAMTQNQGVSSAQANNKTGEVDLLSF